MIGDDGVLRACVVIQALLRVKFGKTNKRIGAWRPELGQLLVHSDGLHHKAVRRVHVSYFSEVIGGPIGLPETGIKIPDGVEHREVLGILLGDLFVFGDGVLQLALLHILLSRTEYFRLVECKTERHVWWIPETFYAITLKHLLHCRRRAAIDSLAKTTVPRLQISGQ